ncbi:hypothetical protein SeLEV6574_g04791 [Synchytrium endobioticum]|uniref:Uncharacterized protein n=1 Tax=Synchytrium endobioticum TaxID=286115 RepID=A0A507CXL4_9FUNG|nr:hypothetical protein SeLEV6574_g04799 [Synchytrium endobioticum]TPX43934.1 hypothetical protein SeLEV6574_g04791 [Synchytrium endobioticum]
MDASFLISTAAATVGLVVLPLYRLYQGRKAQAEQERQLAPRPTSSLGKRTREDSPPAGHPKRVNLGVPARFKGVVAVDETTTTSPLKRKRRGCYGLHDDDDEDDDGDDDDPSQMDAEKSPKKQKTDPAQEYSHAVERPMNAAKAIVARRRRRTRSYRRFAKSRSPSSLKATFIPEYEADEDKENIPAGGQSIKASLFVNIASDSTATSTLFKPVSGVVGFQVPITTPSLPKSRNIGASNVQASSTTALEGAQSSLFAIGNPAPKVVNGHAFGRNQNHNSHSSARNALVSFGQTHSNPQPLVYDQFVPRPSAQVLPAPALAHISSFDHALQQPGTTRSSVCNNSVDFEQAPATAAGYDSGQPHHRIPFAIRQQQQQPSYTGSALFGQVVSAAASTPSVILTRSQQANGRFQVFPGARPGRIGGTPWRYESGR